MNHVAVGKHCNDCGYEWLERISRIVTDRKRLCPKCWKRKNIMDKKIPAMHCDECDHIWSPRSKKPTKCPRCQIPL